MVIFLGLNTCDHYATIHRKKKEIKFFVYIKVATLVDLQGIFLHGSFHWLFWGFPFSIKFFKNWVRQVLETCCTDNTLSIQQVSSYDMILEIEQVLIILVKVVVITPIVLFNGNVNLSKTKMIVCWFQRQNWMTRFD